MFVKSRPLTTADQNAPFGERIIPLGRSTQITVDLATKYVLNGAVQAFREHVIPAGAEYSLHAIWANSDVSRRK